MTYARLSAVYHLSFADISAMPFSAISAYLDRIPSIQAELRLIAGDGASLPYTKDPKAVMKSWRKTAYQYSDQQPRVATPAVLKMMGIGVDYAS